MSADGKHVAFMTNAQLSPEDQDSRADVYLVDRNLGTTRLLDTGTLNGDVVFPSLAANGRFVAFYFYSATWPVQSGVFVSDRDADTDGIFDETGAVTTVRVSVRTSGALPTSVISTYGVSISPDGRFVAFDMVTPDLAPPYTPPFGARADVYVHDRDPDQDGLYDEPGATTTVRAGVPSGGATLGNAASGRPSMSDAGVVVFESSSTNLVPGDTNEIPDVFTHDVVTGHTECVSVNSGELQALGAGTSGSVHASISADGRFVAFESEANNLVPADTNSSADVFRRDRMAGETVRVSVTADGFEITTLLFAAGENPHISADGDFVTFESDSLDIVPLPGFSYTTGNLYLRNLGNPEEASAPDRPCGINPSGSLTLLAGRPAIGMTMTLGVDNPLGTQNPGSLSLVAFSAQAVPTWPCGVLIRGAGMASRGAPGELFLRLPWLRIMGSPWTGPGSPAPVDVHIPLDPALMGLVVYAQGALIDPTAAVGGGVFVGLTRGMELQIGD
jgi:hypothetical protein